MKKRGFNIIDIFIILVVVACVVGIAVRAFKLTDYETEKYYNYRVSFTARMDEKQLEAVDAGIMLSDGKGAEYKLLEGYWIESGEKSSTLNGELLVPGRITENGFECDGGLYCKNDVIVLKGAEITFDATLIDFIKQ